MRDPKRIDEATSKLNSLWHKLPDYRFWQIIQVLHVPEDKANTDPFFWEDDVWIKMFEETANKLDGGK